MLSALKRFFGIPEIQQPVTVATIANTRLDGWVNPYTGSSVPGVDKLIHGQFEYQPLDRFTLDNLYYGNDIARKIIDHIVYDAFREGYTISMGESSKEEDVKKIQKRAEELHVDQKLQAGFKWARLYGGSGILLGIQDFKPLSEPAEDDAAVDFTYIRPVDKRYAFSSFWNEDVTSPEYGDPAVWLVGAYSGPFAYVHSSRFFAIRGISTDEVMKRRLQGWGFPSLQPVYDVLQGLGQAEHAAIQILADMNLDVFKLKGLTAAVASNNTAIVQERMHDVNMRKSAHRAMLIDADSEAMERLAGNVSGGVGPILDHVLYRIACAADMPVSILFGRSPAGMNATGDMDIRIWYDRVKAYQKDQIKPILMQILRRIALSLDIDPTDLDVEFRSLYQLSASEQAQVYSQTATADVAYIGEGVLTIEEVAKSRFGKGPKFNQDTEIDPDVDREKPVDPLPPMPPGAAKPGTAKPGAKPAPTKPKAPPGAKDSAK